MKKLYQTVSATIFMNRSGNQAEAQPVGLTTLCSLSQPDPYQSDCVKTID